MLKVELVSKTYTKAGRFWFTRDTPLAIANKDCISSQENGMQHWKITPFYNREHN